MHWTRVSLFCLGAALLASSQPAFAQVVNEQTGVVQLEDYSGSMSLANDGGSWLQVDRTSGDGVGFQSGFTRIGIRNKWADFGNSHIFTEVNGTINDQKRLGANVGLGYRSVYDGGVFGLHGWYDNYESNYGNNYQQAVVGAEYLHQWLDLRANGYMPFGDRDNFIGIIDPGTEVTCFGHDFGTIGTGQVERSLAGFDAEAGVPLPVATFLRLYGGTYFLTASGDDTWGVRSRLEARIGQGAALNFMVSDDERFGTNLNFGATIWYGGGPTSPFKFQRDRSGWSRIYDPVRRNQPVQLAQDRVNVNVPLINTDTGVRFNVAWVDNTAPAGGDGTEENPFNQLPNAAPGSDYILVKRGVGNTIGNIVLEDDQHLFGEGRLFFINTDRLGTIAIPDHCLEQTGLRPTLAPRPGFENVPIVTLADNNEVINFNMTGGTAPAIFGNVVEDFRIEHINITSDIGIFIDDASGNGLLNNIQVPNIANNQTGISIRNTGGDQLNLRMTDISTSGGDTGVAIFADSANIIADIDGLTIDDTDDTALILTQVNGLLNVDLTDATINSNNDGIRIDSFLGQSNIDLTDVTVRGAGDLIAINGGLGTILTVDGLNVDASFSAAGSGIIIDVNDTVGGLFRFTNLIASNNAVDGFRLNADNGSLVQAEIHDSDVSFNGDNNFDVTAMGGSVVVFIVDPTTGTDSGAEAYQFLATDPGTVLTSDFDDVDLARAGQSAISGIVTNGALSRMFLDNVQASDSGLHGLTVNVVNGQVGDSSDFEAFINNSTFTRSGLLTNGRGVNLLAANNANILFQMDGTPANNNGAEGLHYEALTGANGPATINGTVTNGNFSDNPDYNIFGLVSGVGSTATWNFTDVTADLVSANGSVVLASIAGGQQDIAWTGATSSISQSLNDGVNLTADGVGSVVNFAFSDGRINSNGVQGIDALSLNGGAIQVDLNNAEVTLNTNENILGAAQANSSTFINALNSDLSRGGQTTGLDNVLLTATGANSIVGGIFDGVNLDDSGLNGLHANITALGSLDLQFLSSDPLNPSSASNNSAGSGIRIEGANADSMIVVSSGDSLITDNFLDNVDVDIATANVASIQIAGFMDRSQTGDGINVNFDSVGALGNSGISIGPGSASDNFDDGVDISVSNSTLDQGISVVGMTVTGNGAEPIKIFTTNSTITGGSIDGNTTDGGTNGISWTSDSDVSVEIDISNNVITNATTNGILVDLLGTTTANNVHIGTNTVTGDGLTPVNGIRLNVRDSAHLITGSIDSQNSVSGASSNGILVDVTNTGIVDDLTIDANILSANGADGVLYSGAAGTTLGNLVLSDNSSDQNGANGLNVQLDGVLGNGTVEFRGNLVTNNAGNGILMTSVDTSLTSVVALANESLTNGGDGIQLDLSAPGGTATLGGVTVQNNLTTDNGGAGINILLAGFDTTVVIPDVILEANASNTNAAEGISVSITDMDAGEVRVDGSTVLGNGADGIFISLVNGDFDLLTVTSNSGSGNTGHGINVFTDNANILATNISGNLLGVSLGGSGTVDDSPPVIRAGFNGLSLAANDDLSTGLVNIGFTANFFGQIFSDCFVNNNGNITFSAPLFTFTPFPLLGNALPIIAPYFGDVDTRGAGSIVTYGQGSVAGRAAFGVNWVDVDYFSATGGGHVSLLNDFQLVLIDRSDISAGDFDMEFNYGSINWETGDASGGTNGLGGSSARAGYSNGIAASFEFAGSAVPGSFLDSGPAATSLVQNNLNSSLLGRYVFSSRGGAFGTAGGNGADGIRIEATNGSNMQNVAIDNNQIANNSGHGVNIILTGGSEFNSTTTGSISGNEISNHASGDGIRLVNPDTGGTDINLTIQGNNIHDNGGQGVNMTLDAGVGVVTPEFIGNTVSDNSGNGLLLSTTDTAQLVVSDFSGNTVSTNAGMGVRIEASGSSSTEFNAGVTAAANGLNTLNANSDAGIGAILTDTATGQFNISGTTVTATVDNILTTDFRGDGVHIRALGNSALLASTVGDAVLSNTTMDGNNGSGVSVFLDDFATAGAFTVQNSTLTNNGLGDITPTFDGDAGFRFVRQGQSTTLGTITADNNVITGNVNGIIAVARQANQFDNYVITNNTIDSNDSVGILLQGEADASISALIQDNSISTNGNEGIRTDLRINSPFDATVVDMGVFGNTISNNGQNGNAARGQGISMNAATGGTTIGGPGALTNIITGNLGEGIQVNNSAFLTIDNNLIQSNGGAAGIDLNANFAPIGIFADVINNQILDNSGDGIEISSLVSGVGATAVLINVDGNDILRNGQDGVEIINNSNSGFNFVTVANNTIEENLDRGVAIFNRGNGANVTTTLSVDVSNNSIQRNEEEGIYVVNTASANQDTDVPSTTALATNGNIQAAPRLTLNVDSNTVANNGISSGFGGTGLVIRVGTSDALTLGNDGETSFTDDGGTFASGRGGIGATVTSNTFGGNFGADFLVESFVSTPDPATTTGSWTDQNEAVRNNANDLFDVDSYQQDPLARIDLTFTGNTGDETDVVRSGAFFDNDEPVFKSRTQNQDNGTDGGVDDNGPFTTGTRRRNAQSLASRTAPLFDDPLLTIAGTGGTANNSDAFLYPGTWSGALGLNTGSTFRVSAGSDLFAAGFASGDTFFSTVSNGVLFGEQVFGWSTF